MLYLVIMHSFYKHYSFIKAQMCEQKLVRTISPEAQDLIPVYLTSKGHHANAMGRRSCDLEISTFQ